MKISDIIVILLFIIPGAIAEKVSYSMDMPSGEKRTEFKELLNGILWSLPIITVVSPIMCLLYEINNISCFTSKFNDIFFVAIFSGISLLLALLIGFFRGFFADDITLLINWFRGVKKRIPIDNKSCWQKIFLDNPDCHFVQILKDGVSIEGFTQWYSLPDEEKEIVIYTPDYLQEDPYYKDYRDNFNLIKQTYINIEKNIVINDYDMENYYSWLQKKIDERNKN